MAQKNLKEPLIPAEDKFSLNLANSEEQPIKTILKH